MKVNTFGKIFQISIFGESHGKLVGITVDGCPAGISIKNEDFLIDLQCRKSGVFGTTKRTEKDLPDIVSGVYNGFSTGAPITILFENGDIDSSGYNKSLPRPSHCDFVAYKKFSGFNDHRGGGHFSGRMTVAIVAAGVIAKKIIRNIKISANILEIHGNRDFSEEITLALEKHDSIGGIIECKIQNVPIGLGEPFFDSIESNLSHLIFSIPGVKGIEFGDGFAMASKYGSEVNDVISDTSGKTSTNHSGGINAGMTNGNEIVFRVAVRPAPTISKPQKTINLETNNQIEIEFKGRHDTCFALRMPPIVEAATAVVIADFLLLSNKYNSYNE